MIVSYCENKRFLSLFLNKMDQTLDLSCRINLFYEQISNQILEPCYEIQAQECFILFKIYQEFHKDTLII